MQCSASYLHGRARPSTRKPCCRLHAGGLGRWRGAGREGLGRWRGAMEALSRSVDLRRDSHNLPRKGGCHCYKMLTSCRFCSIPSLRAAPRNHRAADVHDVAAWTTSSRRTACNACLFELENVFPKKLQAQDLVWMRLLFAISGPRDGHAISSMRFWGSVAPQIVSRVTLGSQITAPVCNPGLGD